MVVVSDPGSVWSNAFTLHVGEFGVNDQLVISNGGAVIDTDGFIGYTLPSTSDNIVKITGPGSLWDNRNDLYIGYNGRGNKMIISNGGTVSNTAGYVGNHRFSSNNMVIVTGLASLWNCRSNLIVGCGDSSNVLMITDGRMVQSANCSIGFGADLSNTAVVAGPGSTLAIQTDLWIGNQSVDNRLLVTSSAIVEASNLLIGYFFPNYTVGNTVVIDSSSIIATNLVDVRQGLILFSSGLLTTSALWLTNGAQSQITFTGGTLQSGGPIHNTGSPLTVGGSAILAKSEMTGNGSHVF